MNKAQFQMLERALSAEISGHPLQTKSRLADRLVESGHMERAAAVIHGVIVRGYCLTHRGRIAYCETCREDEVNIENEVLITLLGAGGGPLTVTVIHRRVAARHPDEAPSWREVANAVSRLSTRGWVVITDEEVVGEDVHPMFSLTAAGDMAARQLRAQAQLEGAKEGRK